MNFYSRAVGYMMIWGLIAGCASGGAVKQQEQVVAQVEAQARQKKLNQNLFAQVPRTAAKVSQDYQLGPEDLLSVVVFGQDNLTRDVRVDGKGQISMPLIETVKVAGLTSRQVERRLKELYGSNYLQDPQITVFVKEYRHQRVAVTGAVNAPGFYEMIGPRSLLEMLAVAGGVRDNAADVVHLVRLREGSGSTKAATESAPLTSFSPNAETIIIDLRRLLMEGALDQNLRLQHGDVVHVPFAGFAYVLGEVNAPGPVPVKQNLRVTQAISMAKGLNEIAAHSGITILRFDDQGNRVSLPINYDLITKGEDQDISLQENDIVFVPDHFGKRVWFTVKSLIRGSVGVAVPTR